MRGRDRCSAMPIGLLAMLLSGGSGRLGDGAEWLREVPQSVGLAQGRKDIPSRLKLLSGWPKTDWRNLLSMPWKPEASTKPLADFPKLSRVAALAATVAKFWLAAPPPTERMSCKCSCCCLSRMKDPKQPVAPSTGICASAQLSLNYSN